MSEPCPVAASAPRPIPLPAASHCRASDRRRKALRWRIHSIHARPWTRLSLDASESREKALAFRRCVVWKASAPADILFSLSIRAKGKRYSKMRRLSSFCLGPLPLRPSELWAAFQDESGALGHPGHSSQYEKTSRSGIRRPRRVKTEQPDLSFSAERGVRI
jgi:hypothetical protein